MQALDGIVVLDMSRRFPGAHSAMFLGDFGAKVIKIDPPGSVIPNPEVDTTTEKFAAYYTPDRNKKGMILNLKTELGKKVFLRMAKKADVVIEGFRPGVMTRIGVGYDKLKAINPRLIYCALTGYGQDGPYAEMPGHDQNYVALSGALSMIGARDGSPYFPSNYLADMAGAGLHGVIGILLALAAREKTGKGQFVDISYLDGTMALLGTDAAFYFVKDKVPKRGETITNGGAPSVQVLKCKDGEYFTIACFELIFWERLCKAIGREDLIPYHVPREDKMDWVLQELQTVFLTKTRDEWWSFLKGKDTCVAPVYNFDEAFSDPHVLHRQMIIEKDHPRIGKVKQIGIPIKLSATPGEVRTLGTPAGADTDEILAWAGYTKQEVRDIRDNGAAE